MSRKKRQSTTGTLLDLWRPPQGAGDAVGCLATTFTFNSTIFEEECLGRFLGIDSTPERDGLAFTLERENALGPVYAGVMVEQENAGVGHSMRWDVLSVRLPSGIQHAKLSLLVWTSQVRLIISSANLTEPGYRANQEVAVAVDFTPEESERDLWNDCTEFLTALLNFVPESAPKTRAVLFIGQAEARVRDWAPAPSRRQLHRRLTCTLPSTGGSADPRGALAEAMAHCKRIGGYAPIRVAIASPFFDQADSDRTAMRALGTGMGRGIKRRISIAVPSATPLGSKVPRLLAPRALVAQARNYASEVEVATLPPVDEGGNRREWHAKMLRLSHDSYIALIVGSSNFTTAGLGTGGRRNAEANLVTLVRSGDGRGDAGALEAVWPNVTTVEDVDGAEWTGGGMEDGEEMAESDRVPLGFLSVTYRAGESKLLTFSMKPDALPARWEIWTTGSDAEILLDAGRVGGSAIAVVPWTRSHPPDTVQVRWDEDHLGILPVNVEDPTELPAPVDIEGMSSEEMLRLLAATNPSAELRHWLRAQNLMGSDDDALDEATPADLDPLRRHDLGETFLYRIRSRARLMANVRANLERPVWSEHALDWRLRGMIGPKEVARRFVREAEAASDPTEALLSAADLLIVLREVRFNDSPGALPKAKVKGTLDEFLRGLVHDLERDLAFTEQLVGQSVFGFWSRIARGAQ